MPKINTYVFYNYETGELFATTNSNENDAYLRAERYFGDDSNPILTRHSFGLIEIHDKEYMEKWWTL